MIGVWIGCKILAIRLSGVWCTILCPVHHSLGLLGVGAAWRLANVEPGSSVAIFGLGSIGLAVWTPWSIALYSFCMLVCSLILIGFLGC